MKKEASEEIRKSEERKLEKRKKRRKKPKIPKKMPESFSGITMLPRSD